MGERPDRGGRRAVAVRASLSRPVRRGPVRGQGRRFAGAFHPPPRALSRIIHAGDTPAKRRRAHVRSCAEALRRLATRPGLAAGVYDAEALDLAAFLAFHLTGIGETIEEAANAWDDRDYWRKSEKLRADYRWAPQTGAAIEADLLAERWDALTTHLVALVPHFADVTITKETRDADAWVGAHRALVRRVAKERAA